MTSKKYCSKHIPGKCCLIGSLCSCCTPECHMWGVGTTPKFFCSLRSQQYLYQHSEDCGAATELTALSRPPIWLGGGGWLPLSNNPTPTFGSSGYQAAALRALLNQCPGMKKSKSGHPTGLETEWDYSGRKGRDGQKKKIGKAKERKEKGEKIRK